MIQFSVCGRILNGLGANAKHLIRLTMNLPPEGSVRCMAVTEKQFAGMIMLVGKPRIQEKMVDTRQLSLF